MLIKPAARVVVTSPGWDGEALIGPLPAGARLVAASEAGQPADVVIAFVHNEAELRASLPAAAEAASSGL